MANSHSDINMLQQSPILSTLAESNARKVTYEVYGHCYSVMAPEKTGGV
jgi:hypothetical protein